MNKEEITLITIFNTLNSLDYLTTKEILSTGGYECNPFIKFLIKKKMFGFSKILTSLIVTMLIKNDDKTKLLSKILIMFYFYVVSHNSKEILKHKKDTKDD